MTAVAFVPAVPVLPGATATQENHQVAGSKLIDRLVQRDATTPKSGKPRVHVGDHRVAGSAIVADATMGGGILRRLRRGHDFDLPPEARLSGSS